MNMPSIWAEEEQKRKSEFLKKCRSTPNMAGWTVLLIILCVAGVLLEKGFSPQISGEIKNQGDVNGAAKYAANQCIKGERGE